MVIKEKLKTIRKFGFKYIWYLLLLKCGLIESDQVSRYVEPYYLGLTQKEREEDLKECFFKSMRYPLNLEKPHTFNEKIQWLKMYDSTSKKTMLADKVRVREWIAESIGEKYLVPLLGIWESFDEIDFSILPKRFVLKASHGSGMNIIVKDVDCLNKKSAKKKMDAWMKTDYGINQTQQWHYLNIPHRIVAEQYLETNDGDLPDYKVYCFNGVPTYVQVIKGRLGDERQIFLNTNWERMPFGHTGIPMMEDTPMRPRLLEEMICLSQNLSDGFAFVRVDWYIVDDQNLYFGEMTFTPADGTRHWIPKETDEKLGDMIYLPTDSRN